MLRLSFPLQAFVTFARRAVLSLLLFSLLLTVATGSKNVEAQIPPALALPEAPVSAAKAETVRSIAEWQADVRGRLAEAKLLLKEAEAAKETPAPTLKRQLEILSRIDLTLGQQIAAEEQTKKINGEREQIQKDLKQLIQHGLSVSDSASIRQLDQLRDELRSEERRLQRLEEKEKAAALSREKSREDAKRKSSARRLIKEKVQGNSEASLRQELGEKLAEAIQLSEMADAVARLRKEEVAQAKAATSLQELHVELLKEKEARLQAAAKFGPEELNALLVELDRQEDDLKSHVASMESAADTRLKYLENQWITAQRQLDESTENKPALREKLKAIELDRQALKESPPLLRVQLDRLSRDRKIWQRRQRVFSVRPDGKRIRAWTEESTDALAQLKREERTEIFETEELREQQDSLEAQLKKVKGNSFEATFLTQQIKSLRGLHHSHQESLNSIRTSQQLHARLLSELEGDSLATSAKDQLQNLWHRVEGIWNYELISFGDKENEEFVTVRKVVTALMVLLAGIIFSRALSRALGRQVLRRLDIDPSASATIQSLFYYALMLMFGLFSLNVARVPLTAFTVLGGAVALGIGFGSQNIINNFISGLILLAERPVKVGDLIQIDNLYGNIEHIGARSTRVRTGSNLEIIVPNSSFLQNNVINFTLSSDKVRTLVEVGVVYGSPTVTVTQLLRRAVVETGRVAKDPPPIILFKEFGGSSLVFEVHFWIRMRTMMDQMQIESAVRFRIDQLFREEGIVIAFPQQDVHLDTSSPLSIQMVETPTDPQN